jgi:magnesium chelatase family protein
MSFATIATRAQIGVASPTVAVEVHLAGGLPAFNIVGLPETAVRESRDRVRSAIVNSGFEFPSAGRLTVNLAPADLPKLGSRYDLAIALGILAATGQIEAANCAGFEFIGELALNGSLRAVTGALPVALACRSAGHALVLPADNAAEVAPVRGVALLPAPSLLAVCAHLCGGAPLQAATPAPFAAPPQTADLAAVRGQPRAKRALAIAAAGRHNLLMSGPPGTGKTLLATRLPGILPPLTDEEWLEVAAAHSVAGLRDGTLFGRQPPFRAPHHSASGIALVGGGTHPRPGEITLAHRGVLFLDELTEWPRRHLELLREPLESGEIAIARALRRVSFPARFQLVAAMNPCPCGYLGSGFRDCRCSPDQVQRYRDRISGPLLDRFDLRVEVSSPGSALLEPAAPAASESSATLRERVCAARERQLRRQGAPNSELRDALLGQTVPLADADRALLAHAMQRWGLSARACHRVLRVARSIADLADRDELQSADLAEALGYRLGDGGAPSA